MTLNARGRRMKARVFQLFAAVAIVGLADAHAELMTSADLRDFENPPPDERIAYGEDPLQFGDLRLPSGDGPHPVAIFVHGGCWRSKFDIKHSSKLTAALAQNGIATWSLEYRRVGDPGGGWPASFQDVSRGAEHLKEIALNYQLDLSRVILMGHSAGGHMALWLAARPQVPEGTPLAVDDPIAVKGVLALAPATDLAELHAAKVCDHIIDKLMHGSPERFPARYRWSDPVTLAPAGVAQRLILGAHDEICAPWGERYFKIASERGDDVQKIDAPESGHFEMINPDSSSWSIVLGAARDLLEIPPN